MYVVVFSVIFRMILSRTDPLRGIACPLRFSGVVASAPSHAAAAAATAETLPAGRRTSLLPTDSFLQKS